MNERPGAYDADPGPDDVDPGPCWQCSGRGHLGSDCIDDLCHGGEVPCMHGSTRTIPCDICDGEESW